MHLRNSFAFRLCLLCGAVLLFVVVSATAFAQQRPPSFTNPPPPAGEIVLPPGTPDPLEPFNRAMWAFNKGLLRDVIKPTARGYRAIVPGRVRTGIANVGHNLTFPDRFINNALQGKWAGVRDETYSFLANTILGGVGFVDISGMQHVPRWDADFGQTFGLWGWHPRFYLMLPLFGPSNDRDSLGFAADTAVNPLLYISPYNFEFSDPTTYFGPYSYFVYFVTYNNLSDSVNSRVSMAESEMDAYQDIHYLWTFAREMRTPDFRSNGVPDESSLDTLHSIFFTSRGENFLNDSKTRSVVIPSTGKRLNYSLWLQKGNAPVVYLVAGIGAHRLSSTSMALAELAYTNGYSVVSVSSPFNAEFMESASTAAVPAYTPVDGNDMHVALTEIDRQLSKKYPGRLGQKILSGYSMGAFDTLYIAGTAATNNLLKFDRYVAMDTPVRLLHGVAMLDQFYQAPVAWPAAERTSDIENTFLKVSSIVSGAPIDQSKTLPFSGTESQFLVAVNFRFILRDIIYDSQARTNLGILHNPIRKSNRKDIYREIMQYSFQDYFEKFVTPYYASRGLGTNAGTLVDKAGDLRTYADGLRNANVHVVVNQNDFLLAPEDLEWLRTTFGSGALTVFPRGGHLGNFIIPEVQQKIVEDWGGAANGRKVTSTK